MVDAFPPPTGLPTVSSAVFDPPKLRSSVALLIFLGTLSDLLNITPKIFDIGPASEVLGKTNREVLPISTVMVRQSVVREFFMAEH